MIYNHPNAFHKKRSDQHEWNEKAVAFGVM